MEADKLCSLLKEIEQLRVKIDNVQCEYPYRLNVIDELHINENGHSRILSKLLQYRSESGQYIYLESLLNYVNTHKSVNFPTRVHPNPNITQEEERVDLWVRDKDFALIFENKACGAYDQDTQLFRYIQRTKNHGYLDNQIYVIYLPPTNDSAPSDYSWNGLESEFAERFVQLSFRDDIVEWMQNEVIPQINPKDKLLGTAMFQYCDYLKEMFNLNGNNMESHIWKVLDEEFNLPQDIEEKNIALFDASNKYQEVLNEISRYRDSVNTELNERIKAFLHSDEVKKIASNLKYIDENRGGYQFVCEGKTIDFVIGLGGIRWYVQMQWNDATPYNDRNYPDILKTDKDIFEVGGKYTLNELSSWKFIYRYCQNLNETFDVYMHVLKRIVEICDK